MKKLGIVTAFAALMESRGVTLHQPPRGPHLCHKCGKVFAGRTALKQHTKDVHTKGPTP